MHKPAAPGVRESAIVLWMAGESVSSISRMLGVSRPAVYKWTKDRQRLAISLPHFEVTEGSLGDLLLKGLAREENDREAW